MDGDPLYYDTHYWHPAGPRSASDRDRYRTEYGFPTLPKLLDAARRPFTAAGLNIPWYTCFGNHDGLAQGNFPPNTIPTSTTRDRRRQGDLTAGRRLPGRPLDPEGSHPRLGASAASPSRRTPSP